MSRFDNFNPIDRAELEKMSTEELNVILDSSIEPDARISTDTVMLVLEVLEARAEDTQTPELDTAWEAIKNEHLPKAGQLASKNENETNNRNGHTIRPSRQKHKSLTNVAGIAAAILIIVFTAVSLIPPAQGTDFWTSFIEWTKETFGFGNNVTERAENELPEQLTELDEYLRSYMLSLPGMLPTFIPDGYQSVLNKVDDRENVIVFLTQLQKGDNNIVLQYRFWKDNHSEAESQKDINAPEEYIGASGQVFYVAQNEGIYNATWSKGNIECSIFNVPSREELILILDSIRGES